MSNKVLMNSIPNKKILLNIKLIEESIENSEQLLIDSYVGYVATPLNNWHLHDARSLIRASIRCRHKQISRLKAKLFVF